MHVCMYVCVCVCLEKCRYLIVCMHIEDLSLPFKLCVIMNLDLHSHY